MMFLMRLLVFMLISTMEVHVKASEVLQDPSNCLTNSIKDCLLITADVGSKVDLAGDGEIYLGANTLIMRDESGVWNLIRGVLRWSNSMNQKSKTHHSKISKFKTIVGMFETQDGDIILYHNKADLISRVFVLDGSIKVMLKSPGVPYYQLPAGTTNWFGAINSKGFNDEGIPHSLVWKELSQYVGLENWYLVLKDKKEIKDNESEHIEAVSLFYKDLVTEINKLHSDRVLAEENKQKAQEEEAQHVRTLFRKKIQTQIMDDELN